MHQGQNHSRGETGDPPSSDRRQFIAKASAICLGGLAMAAPVAAGVMVILDPLRRRSGDRELIRVTTLQSVPEDGRPRKFVVVDSRSDAWTVSPSAPVGAIYLRRTGPKAVQALNVVCPHLGCFVDFVGSQNGYFCPCHNSAFAMDGSVSDPDSPSPRGLDELEVEIRNETEVWVRFQNFLTSHKRKIPVA